MKPALYYPWVYLKGGAERVILELMTRSRHDWTLYTNHFAPSSTFPELADVNVVQLREISVRRTIHHVAHAGLTILTQRVDLAKHDSLFVISEGLGNLMAARSPVPTSCICLTPLKVVYDGHTRSRFFAGRRRPHYQTAFRIYESADRRLWRNYVRVFTNSGEVKRRVLDARLVDESRVEVLHHGVDADRWRPDGRREPFFLVAGRIMWQKNIEIAVDSWKLFKPHAGDNQMRLVIAGTVDTKSRPYFDMLKLRAGGRPDIEFVLDPTDAGMLDLYQRARAVIFTPASEDWGLVPLEAMSCGKPVIAVDRGGPRETVVDGSTGYLRPDEPGAFARSIHEIAFMADEDLDAMAARARARALDFPWSGFVERIDEHTDELAALRGLPWRRMSGHAIAHSRPSKQPAAEVEPV